MAPPKSKRFTLYLFIYYNIVSCLGLHSLLKSRRFTVNLSFVPYKRGFFTVNLQVSRGLQILREWRLPPTRAIGWTDQTTNKSIYRSYYYHLKQRVKIRIRMMKLTLILSVKCSNSYSSIIKHMHMTGGWCKLTIMPEVYSKLIAKIRSFHDCKLTAMQPYSCCTGLT